MKACLGIILLSNYQDNLRGAGGRGGYSGEGRGGGERGEGVLREHLAGEAK